MKWAPDEFTGKRLGKYEVLCRLAIGGMAEIFLGFAWRGPFQGRTVVIKRILSEQREDPLALQMLIDEAKLTATLSHPNVAQVMDLEVDGEEVLLVIEFISGANIEELVEAYAARKEAVPLGFALTVIREAAQGLGHAHGHKGPKGESVPVVHRDVTPRNIMVDFEGQTKMLDFGIARAKGSERRTQAGMVRGTTAYMSPEQAIGKDPDTRSDLFSLGTIFHELLTGQRLFYRGNPGQEMAAVYEGEIPLPSAVNRRVPKQLDAVVMRLLERKLERRYQSALEMTRDLQLAAGSTAWGKERVADLVKERFAARQADVEKLVARIPRPAAPAYPEGRTIVSKSPKGPVPAPKVDDDSPRTLVGAQALPDRRLALATEPGRMAPPEALRGGDGGATDPGRPAVSAATQPPQAQFPPGLSEGELFDDVPEPSERTRIIPGGSMRSLPKISELPTDPRRAAVPRDTAPDHAPPEERGSGGGGSKLVLVIAAIVALGLGGLGGAFIFSNMQGKQEQPVATLVKLSLEGDRPAEVFLGKQSLGKLPVSVIVPSGTHVLEVVEEDGVRRKLAMTLAPNQPEAKVVVTLDSLPPVQ